jgi:hypothetical protein
MTLVVSIRYSQLVNLWMDVVGVVRYARPAVFISSNLIAMKDMDAFGPTPSVKTMVAVPALTLPSVRA